MLALQNQSIPVVVGDIARHHLAAVTGAAAVTLALFRLHPATLVEETVRVHLLPGALLDGEGVNRGHLRLHLIDVVVETTQFHPHLAGVRECVMILGPHHPEDVPAADAIQGHFLARVHPLHLLGGDMIPHRRLPAVVQVIARPRPHVV